jgi:hypothetical protein
VTTIASQQASRADSDDTRAATGHRAWILCWLAFLPLVIFRAGVLSEGDTFWQVRIGQLIIAQHTIPATDTFSWTMFGKPYFQNSWGFDVLVAFGYRLGGLPCVAVVCALITLGIIALALALARTLGASVAASGIAFFLALPLLAGWLSARPQLIDYAVVLALVLLLRRMELDHGRWGAAALVGVLTLVWINLHAAALLAVAIASVSAVLLAVSRREPRGWRYAAAAAVAAGAACLVNPYGIGVLHQAGQVHGDSAGVIAEWAPFNPASPTQDLTLAVGLAALVIGWRRRELVLAAALSVCVAGAIKAERFLPFVVILATPLIAAVLSSPPDPIRRYLVSRRVMFQRCGALGIAALVAVAVPSLPHIGRPEPTTYPISLTVDIPRGCRLFTTDLIGSYVTLARPDVPVSLDTRNNLYGPALIAAEERVLHGGGSLSRGLAGAGCVLVPPRYELARRLRNDAQWQLLSANRAAVLYVRRPARSA